VGEQVRRSGGFWARTGEWGRHSLSLLVVACLLALAALNISLRASWNEVEDGVLWVGRAEGVVAAEVAPFGAGAHSGILPGDLLLAIDGAPVETVQDVVDVMHASEAGHRLRYTLVHRGGEQVREVSLLPVPEGNRSLYFVLAAIAIFTLLVGLGVRLTRPNDPATSHFFWLCAAFFSVFAFSFSGRLDRLDWVFYWSDVVALLLLPPLFLHFALVFPERPHAWVRRPAGRVLLLAFYAPAAVLLAGRLVAVLGGVGDGIDLTSLMIGLDRAEMVYLAAGLLGGFGVMLRALGRVRSVIARRQLRWIVWGTALGGVPFVVAYVLPFAFGLETWPRVELLVLPLALVPLAFASAVVRYRLMDVEVIIKRGIVYAVAVSAIAAIYAVLLKLATEVFFGGSEQHHTVIAILATLVVVLLAPLVKNTIQNTLDRAYYRDRYDYRRALVEFARELNSDLDLGRLGARLVERVRHTLTLDRIALLLASPAAGDWVSVSAEGFEASAPLRLSTASGIGGRVLDGHVVALDDPLTSRRFTAGEVDGWRDQGVHYFVPCVSKGGTIAVMALGGKESGEPLSSEDMALLGAVAGQVATALENGRLYQQLQGKMDELNRLRQFSENILSSLTDGLLVAGLDDRVLRWNPALERIYGVPRAEAVGRPLDALFDEPFVAALRAGRDEGEGTMFRVPLQSRHPDARLLLVNTAITPLRTPDGAVAGTIVIVEDTTSRVKLEEQLQISEKMASIGLLAAGVAHEVNTPLTGISSYTQMLLDGADPEDPRSKLLEKIERQTFRAAKIVNNLLNLARPAPTDDMGPVDLHTVIGDVLSLLEHQFRSASIQLRKALDDTSPVVLGVEHKLQQVFLNLFLNARDAMPRGGWLSVSTTQDGKRATVEVADTGSGIPSEQLARIYDPFFTTKPIGQGTGLGLSITYGIVQEHGGTITCVSMPGQGTRFVLSFPLAATVRERAEQAN
jgi:two-component system, NtrC family, sensor kinase